MKRILHISLMLMLVAGTLFLFSFADRKHKATRYKSFSIDIINASEEALITEKEIRSLIEDQIRCEQTVHAPGRRCVPRVHA